MELKVGDLVKVNYPPTQKLTIQELEVHGRYAKVLEKLDDETFSVLPLNSEPISIASSNLGKSDFAYLTVCFRKDEIFELIEAFRPNSCPAGLSNADRINRELKKRLSDYEL